MRLALAEAGKGEGHTRPNPPVGAVLVQGGAVIGRGHHRACGGDHAEVACIENARRQLRRQGRALSPGPANPTTLYVTLEPCSKPGRVGACTDAIAAAGIARVVYAIPDPNPVNRGKAKRALGKRGIECACLLRCGPGPREDGGAARREWEAACAAAQALIAPFAKHVTTGMPYVTVKLAMSLDGKICDGCGDARWVSSAASRKATGALRERVDAIMVGAETVRKDDPSLLSHGRRNDDLIRAIVSRSGRLPKAARVFTDGAPNETLVYRDARAALADLGRRGAMHVLCEGGMKLAVSLAEAGLVDEWLTVLAPKVIGTRRIAEAVAFASRDAFVSTRHLQSSGIPTSLTSIPRLP